MPGQFDSARTYTQVQELGACMHGRTAASRPASTHAPGASTQAGPHDKTSNCTYRCGRAVMKWATPGGAGCGPGQFDSALTLDLGSKPSGFTALHCASALAYCRDKSRPPKAESVTLLVASPPFLASLFRFLAALLFPFPFSILHPSKTFFLSVKELLPFSSTPGPE